MKSKISLSIAILLTTINVVIIVYNIKKYSDLKRNTPIYFSTSTPTFFEDFRPSSPPIIQNKYFAYILTIDNQLTVFKYTTSTNWVTIGTWDFKTKDNSKLTPINFSENEYDYGALIQLMVK